MYVCVYRMYQGGGLRIGDAMFHILSPSIYMALLVMLQKRVSISIEIAAGPFDPLISRTGASKARNLCIASVTCIAKFVIETGVTIQGDIVRTPDLLVT